jgi:tetratricopeptide (TPR) repeat protein
MDDKNPDWQDIFSDSPGLMDKLEELSELQMEGADVFIGSFSMLKNFPFFSEFVNWFIPFYPQHPEISRVMGDKSDEATSTFMEAIVKSPMLCNSDKYSFCLSLQNIPDEYKEMMSGSLKAEMDQVEELQQDELAISPNKAAEVASNQYIQDLYRFYKLYPNHNDFEDVFSWRLDFHNKNTFRPLLQEDPGILRNMAEFYFAKNYFGEASEIYLMLLQEEEDGELLQKLAFCYQKTGQYQEALHYYLKADLFDVNKIWNHKKIALCYRNLKQPEKALEYYKQAEILEPDNLSTHISVGHCYMELKKYEDALKYYFKVEYLSPGNKNVWRPIAWCSLLVGKTEQSGNYYRKLIEGSPNKYDLMNMGHVQWCLGNRKEALEWYRKSIRDKENSEAEFMAAFDEDLEHLLRQGVDKEDVPIMLDQLRYSLES